MGTVHQNCSGPSSLKGGPVCGAGAFGAAGWGAEVPPTQGGWTEAVGVGGVP